MNWGKMHTKIPYVARCKHYKIMIFFNTYEKEMPDQKSSLTQIGFFISYTSLHYKSGNMGEA